MAERILPNLVFTVGVLAIATFRTVYYAEAITEFFSIGHGIFLNWVADFTSLICLTPGLIILFDPVRQEHRSVGFQYLKKFWYLPAMIVLIEALVLLLPSHLPERLWYIVFLPCIAFAVVSGIEGTLLLLFFTNIYLGGIVKILSSNREYIHSQFNKVNALILMKSEISNNLKEILKDFEAHSSTESIAAAAKEFLQKLDVFFAKLELKKGLANELKYVQSVFIKQRVRDELMSSSNKSLI